MSAERQTTSLRRATTSPQASTGPRGVLRRAEGAMRLAGLSLVLLFPGLAHAEDYKLAPGDVLDFSVAGYPDLERKAMIDSEGIVSLPVIGRLKAGDLTLNDLRQQAVDKITRKSIPQPKADGTESWVVFNADQIILDVSEYRPVFIDGDVATPGTQPYRPGMTVKQVIAAAGDYALMRMKVDNPFLSVAELRGQYDVLKVKYEASRIKIARLQAQLRKDSQIEVPTDADPFLSALHGKMASLEQDRLTALNADLEKERISLQQAITKAQRRMQLLEEQLQKDQQGAEEDVEELARVKALFAKGLVQITRVNDAQRSVLLSATRALQTNAQITGLERELGELERSVIKLDDQRQIDTMADLQTENSALAETSAQIESLTTQLIYVQGLKSNLVDASGRRADIKVMRTKDGQTEEIEVEDGTPLQPGDVVSVSLRTNYITDASSGSASSLAAPDAEKPAAAKAGADKPVVAKAGAGKTATDKSRADASTAKKAKVVQN